ncbi:MAG: sigma 54-interacting transcriptional regulator, partial [Planctomycetota bacterium]|nr:sigma 54-interacting transcriptional regulator [Planctomycetota bacterium]
GSFTGASVAKQGLFEIADGGTLFIDEMGEMPASMQAKLLRVLEDGSMRRVGSLQERRVNTRVISATNRNLAKEVEERRFREDLYYRINVMSIDLPPLRIRTGDVPLLISSFLGNTWTIESEGLAALESYSWPGNVRQLINVLERAKILANDGMITLDDLPHEIVADSSSETAIVPATNTLAALERSKVVEVLQRERGNKTRAAKALGITRRSLYRLIDKYGVRTDGLAKPDERG